MKENDVRLFAMALEEAGYEDALGLIKETLIPFAKMAKISLHEAAWKYADQDEEQDTSWFQLFHALRKVPKKKISALDIYKPL